MDRKDLNDSVKRYNPVAIETKWQKCWKEDGVYEFKEDSSAPKWYELTMYPYPSGDLHIGHWYAMSPADTHARFKRMNGFNVLHPMGFDAFGLPAENAAIRDGIHPQIRTQKNIENMRSQLRSMGTIYDWDREVVTCDPEYYKWNQWFFLKLYEKGLAYRDFAPANWCPSCNTVLANEQVKEGRCERCDSEVTRKELNQWFFRITKYSEELLDTTKLQWPNRIKMMQENWIGRSEGVEIEFDISEYGLEQTELTMFTTRIDTVFGVTFVVIAPEHPLVQDLSRPEQKPEINEYIKNARMQSEIERMSLEKEKTGVFTGAYATNPVNGARVPIFISDYVLMTYGTGIVMAVPAHDQRDFDFAKKYGLDIKVVVSPKDWNGSGLEAAFVDDGLQVNSGKFDGMITKNSKIAIADHVEENGLGRKTIQYRMRDWLISRQRYWGTPIPIIYCESCGTKPVPYADLPVLLPEDAEFKPTGESPLKSIDSFTNVECPECSKPARREIDTMDTFVDSSWYQFRFITPHDKTSPFNYDSVKKLGPVDQYTGGAEHAVMHLLYARFFTKAMRDLGLLDFDEPFLRLFNQGHIIYQSQKMSKSRGNVVSPDEYVAKYGADSIRCYLMFLGPWDQGGEWSDSGLNGVVRWINRAYEIVLRDQSVLEQNIRSAESEQSLNRTLHQTIKRVSEDLEKFKFNTAIAALMEFTNALNSHWNNKQIGCDAWTDSIRNLVLMLAPFAPHLAEELWEKTSNEYSIHSKSFPKWKPEFVKEDTFNLVIQINGKVRDKVLADATIDESQAKEIALSRDNIFKYVDGKSIKRCIYIQKKLINIVVG